VFSRVDRKVIGGSSRTTFGSECPSKSVLLRGICRVPGFVMLRRARVVDSGTAEAGTFFIETLPLGCAAARVSVRSVVVRGGSAADRRSDEDVL
jgi:hypothetical protein